MLEEPLSELYYTLYLDLKTWVRTHPELKKHITPHNLKYLFEFSKTDGLIIDLCRFDLAYYNQTFGFLSSHKNVQGFVKKVCLTMRDTLVRIQRPELEISIWIQHKKSDNTWVQKQRIDRAFNGYNMSSLMKQTGLRDIKPALH